MAKRLGVFIIVSAMLIGVMFLTAFAQTSAEISLTSGSITINGETFTAPPPQTISADPGDMITWGDDATGEITLPNGTVIDLAQPAGLPSTNVTTIELALDGAACDGDDENCVELISGGIVIVDDNVTLCHVPPGSQDSPNTIEVGASAVDAHLAHGDSLGPCGSDDEVVAAVVIVACGTGSSTIVVAPGSEVSIVIGADGFATVTVVSGSAEVDGVEVGPNQQVTLNLATCLVSGPVPASGVGGAQLPAFYQNR